MANKDARTVHQPRRLLISAAARRLGLSTARVRKFDAILRPSRDLAGARVYSAARVEALAASRAAQPPQRGRPRKDGGAE